MGNMKVPRSLGRFGKPGPVSCVFAAAVAWAFAAALLACAGRGQTYRDVVQDLADQPVGEITPLLSVNQSFSPNHGGLTGVSVFMATWARSNHCDVTFRLRLDGEDRDVSTQPIKCSEIKDNALVRFDFPAIPDSLGRRYVLSFESANAAPGNAITLWMSGIPGAYPDGTLSFNGKPVPGALRFTTYHRE